MSQVFILKFAQYEPRKIIRFHIEAAPLTDDNKFRQFYFFLKQKSRFCVPSKDSYRLLSSERKKVITVKGEDSPFRALMSLMNFPDPSCLSCIKEI